MSLQHLPPENRFADHLVADWLLKKEVGRGRNGVVYRGEREIVPGVYDSGAVKLIPSPNLRPGWQMEIKKAVLLAGIEQIVSFKEAHTDTVLDGTSYAIVIWEFIDGVTLQEYASRYSLSINLSFVENLIKQLLRAFLAMKHLGIRHDDLHEGNVLIAHPDPKRYETAGTIRVTDFGIGGSLNDLVPRDDYVQLASICHGLLAEYIDPATLSTPLDKLRYKYLVNDFFPKAVLETDPTVGTFVRNPRELISLLEENFSNPPQTEPPPPTILKSPFDYLSCEQIGDSFVLLHALYSQNFPGYDDLLQKAAL